MTKEDLEKLIADKPPEVKAKAILLFNGYVQARSNYQKEPSTANRKTWEDVEAALNEYVSAISPAVTGDTLPNIAAVLQYLQGEGWKETKTSLYRRQKEGKILPRPDGTYAKKDVDKYARTFLKQIATGKRLSENTDELQRKKLEQELKNLILKNERENFNYEKDRGLYIPKDQMEIELATRAGILVAGLKHWVQTRSADWIAAVSGDAKKVGELINMMSNDVDEHINQYAGSKEYEVVIGEEEIQ